MRDPLFIAYHTPGPYAGDAVILKLSLDALNIESEVVDVGPIATWDEATHRKATFVREMQVKYPDRPLVYIDVDAIVLRKPELFWRMEGVDVAAYGRPPRSDVFWDGLFRSNGRCASSRRSLG